MFNAKSFRGNSLELRNGEITFFIFCSEHLSRQEKKDETGTAYCHNDSKTSDKSLIFLNLFISFLLTFICIIFFFMFRSRPGSDIIFHKLLVEREFGIPALAKSLVSFIWSIKCITLSYYMDGAVRKLCHGLNYFTKGIFEDLKFFFYLKRRFTEIILRSLKWVNVNQNIFHKRKSFLNLRKLP